MKAGEILGKDVYKEFPLLEGCEPQDQDLGELLLNKSWRPQLCVVGMDGIPDLKGGNVLRKQTTAKLSIRLPPTCDHNAARRAVKRVIEKGPYPYGAKVSFTDAMSAPGFGCPVFTPWLVNSMNRASMAFWGKPPAFFGEGGSIPFMDFLQKMFPEAQFVVTGLLGPASNAHAPDEMFHIGMFKGLAASISVMISDFTSHMNGQEVP